MHGITAMAPGLQCSMYTSDPVLDVHQQSEGSRQVWDSLEKLSFIPSLSLYLNVDGNYGNYEGVGEVLLSYTNIKHVELSMDYCKKATLLLEAIGGLSSICDLSLHIFCQHWSRESYSNVRWMSKLTSVTLLRMSDLLVDAVPPVACIKWLSHLELSTVGGAHKDAFQFIAGLTLLTELSLSMEFGPVK